MVNKKPHFKKVPLFIFQFPSPPTLNIWLFHLLNLYFFVTYIYSSSIFFFFGVFSSSSSFSFFFFLSQGHMKQKNGSHYPFHPVSARIGSIGLFQWPFRLESAVSACFNGHISCIGFHFHRNRPVLARISTNPAKSARISLNLAKSARIQKKKRGGESASRTSDARWAASNSSATALEPHRCFLD